MKITIETRLGQKRLEYLTKQTRKVLPVEQLLERKDMYEVREYKPSYIADPMTNSMNWIKQEEEILLTLVSKEKPEEEEIETTITIGVTMADDSNMNLMKNVTTEYFRLEEKLGEIIFGGEVLLEQAELMRNASPQRYQDDISARLYTYYQGLVRSKRIEKAEYSPNQLFLIHGTGILCDPITGALLERYQWSGQVPEIGNDFREKAIEYFRAFAGKWKLPDTVYGIMENLIEDFPFVTEKTTCTYVQKIHAELQEMLDTQHEQEERDAKQKADWEAVTKRYFCQTSTDGESTEFPEAWERRMVGTGYR